MWMIYKKEMLDLIRDRKTLVFIVLLPTLLIPLLLGAVVYFSAMAHYEEKTRVLNYSVIGGEGFELVTEKLNNSESFNFVSFVGTENPKSFIQSSNVDFVLAFPALSVPLESAKDVVQVELFFNDSATAGKIYERVDSFFNELSRTIQEKKFESIDISSSEMESYSNPVKLVKRDTAKKRESIGEKIGGILPYILILICFAGAAYPCVDIGVGEKERNTLETLLLTPVSRLSIVFAKNLVLVTTSLLGVSLSVLSLALWVFIVLSFFAISEIVEVLNSFEIVDLMMIFALLLPLSFIFSAFLLGASIYSRSLKEAQNYIQPMSLVLLVATIVAMLPGFDMNWKIALMPVTNVAVAMKELLKGTMQYEYLYFILFSSVLYAAILSYSSTYWFNKESVLYRS